MNAEILHPKFYERAKSGYIEYLEKKNYLVSNTEKFNIAVNPKMDYENNKIDFGINKDKFVRTSLLDLKETNYFIKYNPISLYQYGIKNKYKINSIKLLHIYKPYLIYKFIYKSVFKVLDSLNQEFQIEDDVYNNTMYVDMFNLHFMEINHFIFLEILDNLRLIKKFYGFNTEVVMSKNDIGEKDIIRAIKEENGEEIKYKDYDEFLNNNHSIITDTAESIITSTISLIIKNTMYEYIDIENILGVIYKINFLEIEGFQHFMQTLLELHRAIDFKNIALLDISYTTSKNYPIIDLKDINTITGYFTELIDTDTILLKDNMIINLIKSYKE